MAIRTITAANAVFMLTAGALYPVAQQLANYMADDVFDTDDVDISETVMGVDGNLSVGFVNNPVDQTIYIMPDSATSDLFDNIYSAQKAAGEVIVLTATVTLPGPQKKFACTKGVLKRLKPIPSVKKVVQGRPFRITWQSVLPTLYTGS
jgi:hypothetical protein